MTKLYFLTLLVSFTLVSAYGQAMSGFYISIPDDSSKGGGRLKFLSDTTVELSSIPWHMNRSVKSVRKFMSTDTTIIIFPPPLEKRERLPPGVYRPSLGPDTIIILTKIERGFIDYHRSLIYVREKDYHRNPGMAYIIDGKTYIQDMGVTNGYGLIRKMPKTNRALRKKLKEINIDNSTIEIVRGLSAYKRFGIERAYGAIVITKKK